MQQVTQSLADFLSQRLDEDEALARAAQATSATPWRAAYGRQVDTSDGHLVTPEDEQSEPDEPSDDVARHIARHNPARVLADVAAKREVVRLHDDNGFDRECEHDVRDNGCRTLRALASVYADHPDFREEWR